MQEEIWKDIDGYEGIYQVSNLGRVKSLKRKVNTKGGGTRYSPSKILTNCFDNKYYHVRLYRNGVAKIHLVHRLVADAFLPNPNNKPQVNHIDGDKLNNRFDNLEWCTASENAKHAFRVGLHKPNDGGTSRPIKAYHINGRFVGQYLSLHDAERKLGVNIGHIWCVLNGREDNAKGYRFEYIDN